MSLLVFSGRVRDHLEHMGPWCSISPVIRCYQSKPRASDRTLPLIFFILAMLFQPWDPKGTPRMVSHTPSFVPLTPSSSGNWQHC